MKAFDQSQLLQASFANISFYVEKQQETLNMNIVKHKLLGIDGLVVQHLGLGEQLIKVPAYLVGADYLSQLKQLKEVIITKQISKLILPFDFSEDAVCENIEITQEFDKTGKAALELSFVIGKEAKALTVEFDNSYDFNLQSDIVKNQSLFKLLREFSVEGFDSKQVKNLSNKLNEIVGIKKQIDTFEFSQLFAQSTAFSESIIKFVDSFNKVDYSDEVDKVSKQLNNITQFAKTQNIVNAAQSVTTVKSLNEAIKLQNIIIKNIDEQLDYLEKTNQITLNNDDTYLTLKNFKQTFIKYNRQLSINLPNLTKYNNKIVRPTVLIAYDIANGNNKNLEQIEADIIARNNIKQISAVKIQELEVLNV